MAYWTIDFMTKAGRPIHILINKPGTTDVALQPSDNPVEIEEEGKEDLFETVKTQSGYIEVISDDMDLALDIIPTTGGTRTVRIYETMTPTSYTAPLWIGYVQPKLLTFTIWKGKNRLKIPIECRLSALKYATASLPNTPKVAISTLLNRNLPYCQFLYFQGAMVMERPNETADQARAWLRKKIYSSVFYKDSYTKFTVIEQLCTLFGWTCRSQGRDIYFIANRNVDAANTDIQYIMFDDLLDSMYIFLRAQWQEVDLTGSMLYSDSNIVKFTEGIRRATIECSLQSFDQSNNPDFADVATAIDNGSINPQMVHEHEDYPDGEYYDNRYFTQFSTVTIGAWTVEGDNVQTYLNKKGSTDINEWFSSLILWYTTSYRCIKETYPPTPQSPGSSYYRYQVINQYIGHLTFKSVNDITYPTSGTMTIKVEMNSDEFQYPSFDPFYKSEIAYVCIRLGNKYYDPINGWISTQGRSIAIVADSDGYTIPVPTAMSGQLELQFVPNPNSVSNGKIESWYSVEGFTVSFKANQDEVYSSDINSISFSSSETTKFSKTKNFESMICTKDRLNAYSLNFLLNPDETLCEGLYDTPYSDANLFNPLQRLVDQAAAEMSTIGRMYDITVKWRDGIIHDITPLTMIYLDPFNEWAYPVSCIYNLRDDKVRIRMMKRNYNQGNQ